MEMCAQLINLYNKVMTFRYQRKNSNNNIIQQKIRMADNTLSIKIQVNIIANDHWLTVWLVAIKKINEIEMK